MKSEILAIFEVHLVIYLKTELLSAKKVVVTSPQSMAGSTDLRSLKSYAEVPRVPQNCQFVIFCLNFLKIQTSAYYPGFKVSNSSEKPQEPPRRYPGRAVDARGAVVYRAEVKFRSSCRVCVCVSVNLIKRTLTRRQQANPHLETLLGRFGGGGTCRHRVRL